MSSTERFASQIPVNKLYVNIAAINSSIVDTNLSTVAWVDDSSRQDFNVTAALSTPGQAILRDMGKTVYLPASSTSALQSTVLRKVQLVTPESTGDDGTGAYYTGYIEIGGMTYGGGNGTAARVARLN